ncbi:MAG: hypothetical protein OEN55_07035 [Alphaproteobacteria bacterium]|nr:hypothetical protein [Alphaproteobacteria bacterium]
MTAPRHPNPAERLLALLEDEQAVETAPVDEVRADLDAVGVDPARCIAFARSLAGGSDSPGGQLLGAIDLAEDEADEIKRLESADIEAVRAQVPGASAAAIAAQARRQAGADSNIVAIQARRRSRVLRWGGPVAGIAASVLVVVVIGVRFLGPDGLPMFGETRSYMTGGDESPAAEAYRADEAAEPAARYAAPEADRRKRSAERDTTGVTDQLAKQERRETEAPASAPAAPPAGIVGNLNEDLALSDRDDKLPGRQDAGTLATEPQTAIEGFAAKPDVAEEATEGAPGGDVAGLREGSAAAATIAAMVIVDPSQVPLAVQSQALPQPDLAARIDEARRLAGSRPVIALYRVTGPAGRRDFAQVPLELAMTQQMPAPMPLTRLLGAAAFEYDFLALPTE